MISVEVEAEELAIIVFEVDREEDIILELLVYSEHEHNIEYTKGKMVYFTIFPFKLPIEKLEIRYLTYNKVPWTNNKDYFYSILQTKITCAHSITLLRRKIIYIN